MNPPSGMTRPLSGRAMSISGTAQSQTRCRATGSRRTRVPGSVHDPRQSPLDVEGASCGALRFAELFGVPDPTSLLGAVGRMLPVVLPARFATGFTSICRAAIGTVPDLGTNLL